MVLRAFAALLNALLPRHPRAERARRISFQAIARSVAPTTLAKAGWIHALLPYRNEDVRALIQAVKYYGERELAERVAPYAADYLLDLLAEKKAFAGWERVVVVPVAASRKRARERGYNQAALFARAIATELDLPCDEALLTREDRPSQVHTARARRAANVLGSFTASPAASGAAVILIDDVAESGATLTDARRALLEAGARDVIALAIAH